MVCEESYNECKNYLDIKGNEKINLPIGEYIGTLDRWTKKQMIRKKRKKTRKLLVEIQKDMTEIKKWEPCIRNRKGSCKKIDEIKYRIGGRLGKIEEYVKNTRRYVIN